MKILLLGSGGREHASLGKLLRATNVTSFTLPQVMPAQAIVVKMYP